MSDMLILWDRAQNAARRRNLIPANIGRYVGAGVKLTVPNRPGWLFVRLGSDGQLGNAIAYNLGVPVLAHYPVLLQRDGDRLVIVSADPERLAAFQSSSNSGVGKHHHRTGSGLEYEVESAHLEPGRVKHSSGMTVAVNGFRYVKTDGTWDTFTGGTLDLTSYKPVTADTHAWVVVGVDPGDNTLKAATGSEVSAGLALDVAAIDGVLDDSYIPLAAIDVHADDTALNLVARYRDARGWLNIGGAGASTFLELSDTPGDYTGQAGKGLKVNAGATALEFIDFQPLDATLTSLAGLGTAADKLAYTTGVDTWAEAALTAYARTLLDDTTAAAARTTLALGTIATEAETAYAKLAGRAGGQTLRGGTGSGDDLTLESTSNATKGNVIVQPNGGFFGIGITPSYPFHLDFADDITTGILARYRGSRANNNLAVQFYHDGAANTANKMSLALLLETSAQERTAFNIATSFSNITDASRTTKVEFNTAANGTFGPAMTLVGNLLGVGGATNPLGALHVDQDSATAARPVLILDQADLSEEFIEFDATVGAGNPIDTAAIGTYYGKIRVSVNGTFKYIPLYNS